MTRSDDPPPAPAHPTGEMLNAHLLAMLKGWSAYGYELVQRLNEAGLGEYNKGSIYRALRHMEQTGLVSSMWDTGAPGPARRMYSLTGAGTLFLRNWLALLDVHRSMLEQFIAAGEASADDDPDAAPRA
jgi:poly-beta-hydroxybutyrate-responsive repressor